MSATAGGADTQSAGARLGLKAGMVVQELGWDEDVDDTLRVQIEDTIDGDLVDGDYGNVVDSVVLWWRDEDGDLVDALVDSLTDLVGGGVIWLLSPKVGRPGSVDPADVAEAAPWRAWPPRPPWRSARTGPPPGWSPQDRSLTPASQGRSRRCKRSLQLSAPDLRRTGAMLGKAAGLVTNELTTLKVLATAGVIRPYPPQVLVGIVRTLRRWGRGPAGGSPRSRCERPTRSVSSTSAVS